MFQLLKPTLILIFFIAAFIECGKLIYGIFKGDIGTLGFLGTFVILIIVAFCIEYKRYQPNTTNTSDTTESNIVTIDNEDCPEQDKDNQKL